MEWLWHYSDLPEYMRNPHENDPHHHYRGGREGSKRGNFTKQLSKRRKRNKMSRKSKTRNK